MKRLRSAPRSVSVGVLATVSMDAVFLALSRLGGQRFTSDKVGLEMVGRWTAGFAQGRYRHDDIAESPPVHGEALVGLVTHYVTGVALTRIYHDLLAGRGHEPSVRSATAFGAATALLPLLVMYPAWGLGPFALRSGETARLVPIMLLGHTAFGAAIGLWTAVLPQNASQPGPAQR